MKERNKKLIEDDRWKKKGGPHKPADPSPKICLSCGGVGYDEEGQVIWEKCNGEGEIYE